MHEVLDDAGLGEGVGRGGVSVDAAVDGEVGRPRGLAHPVRDVARSEEASGLRSRGARPRAHDVGVAQRLVGPEAYVPAVVEVGRELHPHRGAVGLPGVLVLGATT